MNCPVNNTDEYGLIAGTIVKMIGNFFFGMAGGMLGMYLGNVSLNVFSGKKNIYDKNDTWGSYVAEGIKAGAFAIFGSKLCLKITAAIGAAVIKQIVDVFISKGSFNLWGMVGDIIAGILFVVAIHFGSLVLKNSLREIKQASLLKKSSR